MAARVALSGRPRSTRARVRWVVGAASLSVGAGQAVPVVVELTRRGRSALRRVLRPRLHLSVVAEDAAGNRTRAVRTLAPGR